MERWTLQGILSIRALHNTFTLFIFSIRPTSLPLTFLSSITPSPERMSRRLCHPSGRRDTSCEQCCPLSLLEPQDLSTGTCRFWPGDCQGLLPVCKRYDAGADSGDSARDNRGAPLSRLEDAQGLPSGIGALPGRKKGTDSFVNKSVIIQRLGISTITV